MFHFGFLKSAAGATLNILGSHPQHVLGESSVNCLVCERSVLTSGAGERERDDTHGTFIQVNKSLCCQDKNKQFSKLLLKM